MNIESTTVNFILVNFVSRMEIRVDGVMMAGFSLTKKPQNERDLADALREVLRFLESPIVEDCELI